MRAPAAAAAILLCLTLTACNDDHQTDQNPCGDTGKPVAGSMGSGTPGTFDGVREALYAPLKGGGGGGGGGGKGGSSGASGAKGSTSGGGAKSSTSGGIGQSATRAFPGSTATGSRTFSTGGRNYAVAPRTSIPAYAPPRPYTAGTPSYVYVPTYHPSPYLWWALYGNYPGATTIIECR